MDLLNVLSVVGSLLGGVGGIAGVIALAQTGKANKLAKNANSLADEANKRAGDANLLAEQSNQISNDANAISKRALGVTADQTEYVWMVEFDYETAELVVINDCPLDATDAVIVARCKGETMTELRRDRIAKFSQVRLKADFLREQILKKSRRYSGNGIIIASDIYGETVIHVVWTSELGMRRSEESKQRFGKKPRRKQI